MRSTNARAGSALLLTVMVISLLTTISLGGAAVRYQQYASTDAINDSATAKLAAESGVAALRSALAQGQAPSATQAFDLSRNASLASPGQVENFRPNPRNSVYTIEPGSNNLPRCLAVGVLNPFLSGGTYAFDQSTSANAAMVFRLANIINDTQLKDIPGNSNSTELVSSLTGLGHFYNPNSPAYASQDSFNYWTVNFGGPDDQFVSDKLSDGTSSLYRNLDLLYVPYLPRFVDSSVKAAPKSGSEMKQLFENVITQNNLKIWLDANVSDEQLYSYGLGDLFVNSNEYRLKWLQPSLWNDLSEGQGEELMGPYLSDDITAGTPSWQKLAQPTYNVAADESGWDADIMRGSRPMSFLGPGSDSELTFSPGTTVTLPLYGSLEGLRVNGQINLVLYRTVNAEDARYYQVSLANRSEDQGVLYNALIKSINLGSQNSLTIQLSSNNLDTPKLRNSSAYVKAGALVSIGISGNAQYSASQTFSNLTIKTGSNADLSVPSSPNSQQDCPTSGSAVICLASGDVISLQKVGSTRLWGVVDRVDFDSTGKKVVGFSLDKLRNLPKPVRDFGHLTFIDSDGHTKIAIYGGRLVSNSYDGGVRSESDELWFFDTQDKTWQFIEAAGSKPTRTYGSSLSFEPTSAKLYLFGGAYHDFASNSCSEADIGACLAANQVGQRLALRLTNDVFALNLSNRTWSKTSPTIGSAEKIANGQVYQLKVVSTLNQRSGLEKQTWSMATTISAPTSLSLSGSTNLVTMVKMPAGLAVDDRVYLRGTKVGGADFRAWAIIKSIDFLTKRVGLSIEGTTGASSVSLNGLNIQVLNRSINELSCTGQVILTVSYCSSAGTPKGVSLGDLAVLEKYSGSPVGQIDQSLYGYVTGISGTNIYFSSTEPANDYASQTLNSSAVKLPLPSWGGSSRLYDADLSGPNASQLLVWPSSSVLNPDLKLNPIIWRLDSSAANPTWGAIGSQFSPVKEANPPAGLEYALQAVSLPLNRISFLTSSNNSGPVPQKSGVGASLGPGGWDDSATWQIQFSPADTAKDDLVLNLPIILERQNVTSGNFEIFHGLVKSISGGSTILVGIGHDPNFPGDNGLKGDLNRVKLTAVYSQLSPDATTSNVEVGDDQTISKANNDLVNFPVGSIVALVKISGSNPTSPQAVYLGKVSQRTISANSGIVKVEQRFFDSPNPKPNLSGGFSLTKDSSTEKANWLIVDNVSYKTSGSGFDNFKAGPIEWLSTDLKSLLGGSGSLISWSERAAAKDDGNYPFARQSAAVSLAQQTTGSETKTNLYLTGASFGAYGSLWQQANVGADSTSWQLASSPETASQDIPNLFGGTLEIFGSEAKQAFYFGGKRHFDSQVNDQNITFGPRLVAPNEGASNDTMFSLPANSPDAIGRKIINGIYDFETTTTNRSSFLIDRTNPTNQTCTYIAQANCVGQQLRHLGEFGRSSATQSSYGGYGNGFSLAMINPGSAYRQQNNQATMILSGASRSQASTTGRSELEGYYPYAESAATLSSDKTLLLAGFSQLSLANNSGGSILVTPVGVGQGLIQKAKTESIGPNGTVGYCSRYNTDNSCANLLGWLPDSEDTAFLMSASQTLAQADTYRVIGYYAGTKRAYLVTYRNGVFNIQEGLL